MDSLVAQGVSRFYGSNKVVAGASLELKPGRVTALLGGSGAGKSTLLRLFAGLEPVNEGTISLGENVLSRPGKTVPANKRKTGLIFQDFALFPHMTAQQNVRFGLNHLPKSEATHLALDWLDRLGLTARAKAYPHQLSGGEQQRVAIARALAPGPAAILMDEPFSGLDPALREDVRAAALSAVRAAGIPALLVTHDANEAMTYADYLAVMRDGVIVQQGEPEAVYNRPVDLETAAALGPVNPIPAGSSLAALLGAGSCVREEGIRLDPDGPVRATIVSARQVGGMMSFELEVSGHGRLKARTALTSVEPGQSVNIAFHRAKCFRF